MSRYAVEMSKEQDMERFLKRVGKEVEYDGQKQQRICIPRRRR